MTSNVRKTRRTGRIVIAGFVLAVSIAPALAEEAKPTEKYVHEMCDGLLNPEAKHCITIRIELTHPILPSATCLPWALAHPGIALGLMIPLGAHADHGSNGAGDLPAAVQRS